MTEIFTANSVEEAKDLAAKKFGKSISEISFEIIDEGKKGFLGIGKADAKVKATVKDAVSASPVNPVETVKEAISEVASAAEEKAEEIKETVTDTFTDAVEEVKETAEAVEEKIEEVTAPVVENVVEAAENVAEKAEEIVAPVADEVKEEEHYATPAEEDEAEFSIDNFTLIEDESLLNPKVKIARDYITSVLRAMDVEAGFSIYQNETGAVINIESDNNGTIIGRRGETLDSLQYLCSIIANKGDKDYFRITIDCLGYRSKRKETLQQLAAKVAKSVLRTGRSQPLEPMNPYERRVIHSAISEIEGVSSRSVGEEPYRKIIISSNNPRPNNRRRHNDGDRRNGRGGDRRNNNNRRRTPREPYEPRAIDLSTSFEKDYKKPKPEDTMEGGLYGKIEL